MANLDNKQLFKKNAEPNKDNTIIMVYRAERLYSALGDAQKIFKFVAQLIYDKEPFFNIFDQTTFSQEDEKLLKRREKLLKRLQSQVSNFLSSYKIFDGRFNFKKMAMKDYLIEELDQIEAARRYMSAPDGFQRPQWLQLRGIEAENDDFGTDPESGQSQILSEMPEIEETEENGPILDPKIEITEEMRELEILRLQTIEQIHKYKEILQNKQIIEECLSKVPKSPKFGKIEIWQAPNTKITSEAPNFEKNAKIEDPEFVKNEEFEI